MKRNNISFTIGTIQILFLLLGGILLGFSHSLYVEYKAIHNRPIPLFCKILDTGGVASIIAFFILGLVNLVFQIKGTGSRR